MGCGLLTRIQEVEAESFRNVIEYCNPMAVKKLPKSANTVRSDIMKCFEAAKVTVKENLKIARSKIHLSFDLWTSPNFKAMLAIVGHWTSYEFKVETALLAMKEITGAHKGEFIAPVLHGVAKEFGIDDKLGYFMADNATNNDKALRFLDRAIRNEGRIGFDVEERRLRCLGHILNLAVKVLLFGGNVAALEKEMEDFEDEDVDTNDNDSGEARKWRARGVVGKLHNIVIFIRWSPQRRNKFLDEQLSDLKKVQAFMVAADNDTRWSSTYDMIKSALREKDRIQAFIQGTPELAKDMLTETDWDDLREMLTLLEPFKIVTMLGQERGTRYGSVATILWGMDILLDLLEKAKTLARPNDSGFKKAINLSWKLLDKYYQLTDKSPVHIVSLLLDPRMKFQYFERQWPQVWLEDAKAKVRRFYNQYRQQEEATVQELAPQVQQTTGSMENVTTQITTPTSLDIDTWLFGPTVQRRKDELDDYLSQAVLDFPSKEEREAFDVMEYWRGHLRVWPTLSRMFFDLASIPSMSVEPERVFSG